MNKLWKNPVLAGFVALTMASGAGCVNPANLNYTYRDVGRIQCNRAYVQEVNEGWFDALCGSIRGFGNVCQEAGSAGQNLGYAADQWTRAAKNGACLADEGWQAVRHGRW
ncbi:MAG: hypothetical protein J6Y85_01055 [Alphaproteobacteria bacterium]|nr:hypothetical protein [Alphaproteobacteria bacterium]